MGLWAIPVLLLSLIFCADAQTSSSISGTVKDATGAVIPGARVLLVNEASKGVRSTKSNGEGFFYFAAVQPATYSVDVSYKGFETWRVTGILVNPGDNLTISKIGMKLGAVTASIVVSAETAGVALDSGEHSTLITAGQISRLSTVGRDANELLTILPGFTTNAGTNIQNEGPNYQVAGFGNGNLGALGANGAAPQQGLVNVTSDGANVIDPGDMGGQVSNVNMDQVQEVKVETSNFGADQAKGPIVINAVGKAGSSEYHGDLHGYLRNYAFNSNNWLSKYDGLKRPAEKYFYPGGSFGGPVKIPGTHFNRSERLVFWAGYEYYDQQTLSGMQEAFVPTPAMLAGDLSVNSIAHALNVDPAALQTSCSAPYAPQGAWTNIGGLCYSPDGQTDEWGNKITKGQILTADIDPAVGTYTRFYPKINHVPQPVPDGNGGTQFVSEGYNYVQNVMGSNNGFQLHSRVDENISDSLKLYVTYNWEKVNSASLLNNIYYNPGGTVPYPTPFDSNTGAQYLTLNTTKTFSSTLTNELVLSGVYFNEPQQFANRSLAQVTGTPWAAAGYSGGATGQTLFGPGSTHAKIGNTQLPRLGGYEGVNIPSFSMGYVPSNSEFLKKYDWTVQDNVTKVYRTHSLKLGFYGEKTGDNEMTLGSNANGTMEFMRWGNCYINQTTPTGSAPATMGPGNEVANFLTGCPLSYSQDTSDPNTDLTFSTIEGYLTDEWKATPKLTLTLGIRLSHLGPWTDAHGIGAAVWEPSELHKGVLLSSVTQDPKTWTGFKWHQIDSSIPVAGVPTRALFYQPRLGIAYDALGNGKTVIRGGWGAYHAHDNRYPAGAVSTAIGMQTWTTTNIGCTYGQLFSSSVVPCGYYTPAALRAQTSPFNVNALDSHDDKTPLTYNYNLTLDQVMPWKTTFELAYVGNQSSDLLTLGGLQNQNVIPLGAFFGPDPLTGQVYSPANIPQAADYRPYPNYQTISVPNHIGWSNYNAMQVSLNRQTGNLIFGLNYTWSKALGVRGNWDTGAVGDPVDPHNDYGIVSFDRRHVINANYSWQEGNLFQGNHFLGAVLNQWELSGIGSIQSGPDLAVLNSTNFGFNGGADYYVPGQTAPVSVPISNYTWLGTSDYSLQPTVTCDPRTGLKHNQFVNGSCFGVPAEGSQGVYNLPYVAGPKFLKWDMSVYKDVKVRERQSMQFRLSGFNFLNHPITSFNANNLNALYLQVGDATNTHYATPQQALQGVQIVSGNSFGSTIYKDGQRILELGFKYNF